MLPHPSWYNYFALCTNKASNKYTQVFFNAWALNVLNATKLATITILALAIDNNTQIMVLHSIKNIGGTIINLTNIQG